MSKLINSDNSCSVEIIGDDVVFRSYPIKDCVEFVELKWPMSDLDDLWDWLGSHRSFNPSETATWAGSGLVALDNDSPA